MWGNVLRIAICHATCTDRFVLRIVVDAAPTPLVQRRRLRTELRRARSAADLTQDQVAQAMDWSISKIIRIETGAVNVSTNDLKALLNLYNILDPDRTSQLIELARAARQTSWWNKYKEAISDQYFQLIGYVEAASVVRSYEPLLIPGLLQTPEYAETIFQKFAESGESSNLIQARMKIRLTRQQLFDRPTAPAMFFILDQAAVQRLTGARDIDRDQLDRLIGLASRPNVTIEVIPFSGGLYHGMLESFTIVEFPDPEDSDILYRETSRETIISRDDAEETSIYREDFEDMRRMSLGADGTLSLLANLMEEFS